ncbi:MAG: PfkB family carbohydrate kinase [Candidatus Caldarchaeum sp.]|uniref:Carbohydrate kinase PfkB domain-containing protein n=1 Tax=Caldiarchaeum subterraneum TaxID=311458 RepID=A0A7C5YAZ7_CALS0
MKFGVVGALTIDVYGDKIFLGGPPWFAGGAAASIHHSVNVYSAVGELDFPQSFYDQLVKARVNISKIVKVPDSFSYTFQHNYTQKTRRSKLIRMGPRIPEDSLADIDVDSLLLSPVYREAGENHFKILRNSSSHLALDIQGFLREADDSGNVFLVSKELGHLLKSADVIHCSDEEAVVLSGEADPLQAVKKIARAAPGVVLVGSRTGLLAAHRGMVSFFSINLEHSDVDPTGAGDMLTALLVAFVREADSATEATVSALAHLVELLRRPRESRFIQPVHPRPELVHLLWTTPV